MVQKLAKPLSKQKESKSSRSMIQAFVFKEDTHFPKISKYFTQSFTAEINYWS